MVLTSGCQVFQKKPAEQPIVSAPAASQSRRPPTLDEVTKANSKVARRLSEECDRDADGVIAPQ